MSPVELSNEVFLLLTFLKVAELFMTAGEAMTRLGQLTHLLPCETKLDDSKYVASFRQSKTFSKFNFVRSGDSLKMNMIVVGFKVKLDTL